LIELTGNRIAVTPIFDPLLVGEEHALRPGSRIKLAGGEEAEVGKPVGLHIPDSARDRCDQGIVKYVAPQVKHVKIGDYIIFSGYVGTLVTIDTERLIILPEDFAQCVLHAPATDVAGVYFRGADGEYYTATYEMIFEMIARAFQDAPWHRQLVVTSYRPKIEDYDKLRAGAGT